MKIFIEKVGLRVLALITGTLVLLIFVFPTSKGIFERLIAAATFGDTRPQPDGVQTDDFSSGGAPRSRPVIGPIKNADACSTGRQHDRPHHGHTNATHSHYH